MGEIWKVDRFWNSVNHAGWVCFLFEMFNNDHHIHNINSGCQAYRSDQLYLKPTQFLSLDLSFDQLYFDDMKALGEYPDLLIQMWEETSEWSQRLTLYWHTIMCYSVPLCQTVSPLGKCPIRVGIMASGDYLVRTVGKSPTPYISCGYKGNVALTITQC